MTPEAVVDAPRVVVADDEPDVRLLLRLQLERAGFAVVGEADDGARAVEVVRRGGADVVIMDLLMPRVSGFEAIATLQAEHPEVGIVAYSAVAGDYVRTEMQRLGVELVLKSGDLAPLAAALRRAMRSAPEGTSG
jgi:DNA-binding NarL/FixJ family response regulator